MPTFGNIFGRNQEQLDSRSYHVHNNYMEESLTVKLIWIFDLFFNDGTWLVSENSELVIEMTLNAKY